jgi:hypothetical protein
MTFVHRSLITVTDGRIDVFGLFKLTYKNDRPNNADYRRNEIFVFNRISFTFNRIF